MRYSAFAFLLGITLTQVCSSLPTTNVIYSVVIAGVWLLGVGWHWRWHIITYLGWASLGWAWLFIYAMPVITWHLPTPWVGHTCLAQGKIVNEPSHIGHQRKFMVAIDQLHCQDETITLSSPQRVILNWYAIPPHIKLTRNSYWQLHVRLKPGWGNANPGGFDSEKWLLTQKVHYVGYVVNAVGNQQLQLAKQWTITHNINQWRIRIQTYLHQQLGNIPGQQLLLAMLVGERTHLSPATWHVLQATGTSHLMAISGLHIGMLAGFVGFIVLRIWRCSAKLCIWCPAPIAAYSMALISAIFYSALAGFALPTQRALIMFAIIVLAVLYRRRWLALSGLNIALWIVLLHDPLMTLTAGFWLSFTAVAAIAYGIQGYQHPTRWWRLTRVQWVMSWLLAPVTLWFFSQISLISLLANVVAIPWISLLVLPMGFISLAISALLPTLGQWGLHSSATLLNYLWEYLTWLSHLHYAQWLHPITHIAVLGSAMIGMLLLLAPRGWPMRWVGIIWLLPLYYLPLSIAPAYGAATLTLLDVGQGLAGVIRTQHHILLYDTGPRYSATHNAGQSIVVPYFISQGIHALSRIIVSHGDNDHSGGLTAIVQALPVNSILTSEPSRLSVPTSHCQAGQHWEWDGVTFTMLSPPVATTTHWHDNDKSCVLRVQTKSASILLTGDIERKTERYLTRQIATQLDSDILIVPHHGSRTSSIPDFVNAVAPKLALLPVGYRNRFGFPHPTVMARYQTRRIPSYLSWQCGALTLQLDGSPQQWQPKCWRKMHLRFWHYA